ncbi:hypothetical protein LTS17_010825 [Exophiala oligosperma]
MATSNDEFPIIDISDLDLSSGRSSSQRRVADEVTRACREWGFLLVKNHPIPAEDIEEMFVLSREFFQLPEEVKERYPITKRSIGYVGSFKDRGKDDKMSMWFGGVPGALSSSETHDSVPEFWHRHVAKVEAFKHRCHDLVVGLLECFALALGLPDPKFFADAHREDAGNGNSLRMLMYPARARHDERPNDHRKDTDEEGSRMQAHTDSGSVTLLFQRAPGLEVLSPDGETWARAPHVPGCILINVGDALGFWSGGQLKATRHRVTFEGLPPDKERQSMAYFGAANPDTVLQPIVACGEKKKKMDTYYSNGFELVPGITVGELNRMIMQGIYGAAFESSSSKKQEDNKTLEAERGQATTAVV